MLRSGMMSSRSVISTVVCSTYLWTKLHLREMYMSNVQALLVPSTRSMLYTVDGSLVCIHGFTIKRVNPNQICVPAIHCYEFTASRNTGVFWDLEKMMIYSLSSASPSTTKHHRCLPVLFYTIHLLFDRYNVDIHGKTFFVSQQVESSSLDILSCNTAVILIPLGEKYSQLKTTDFCCCKYSQMVVFPVCIFDHSELPEM